MNVLSLFDGMSCGQIALERAGIKVDNYFASEIKPHAIKVTQHNYPNTIQLGDVTKLDTSQLPKIDLLIGGSPCQDLSMVNVNRPGLKGEKSSLFWVYAKILKDVKPTYFLLENVEMPEEDKLTITKELNVYPININSNLVSAQNRNRWYWTNIQGNDYDMLGNNYIEQPADKYVNYCDILDSGYVDLKKARCLRTKDGWYECNMESAWKRYTTIGMENLVFLSPDLDHKKGFRFLSIPERERLQTIPVGYTSILPFKKAIDVIGDGWTVDVIAHIFSFLPEEYKVIK